MKIRKKYTQQKQKKYKLKSLQLAPTAPLCSIERKFLYVNRNKIQAVRWIGWKHLLFMCLFLSTKHEILYVACIAFSRILYVQYNIHFGSVGPQVEWIRNAKQLRGRPTEELSPFCSRIGECNMVKWLFHVWSCVDVWSNKQSFDIFQWSLKIL